MAALALGTSSCLLHAVDQRHCALDIPAWRGGGRGEEKIVLTVIIKNNVQVSDKKKKKQERQMKRHMR